MVLAPTSRVAASFARPSIFLLIALTFLAFAARQAQATVYYVTTTGLATNSGLSWSSPKTLSSALASASSATNDQVWVMSGTYTGNFIATDGVAVYGHFAGTETSITQRKLNNSSYATILNGSGSGSVYTVPSSAAKTNTLDGFTVENGTGTILSAGSCGGGLYDPSSSDILTISNCTFTGNSATVSANTYGGGSIYAKSHAVTLTGCTFTNNSTF